MLIDDRDLDSSLVFLLKNHSGTLHTRANMLTLRFVQFPSPSLALPHLHHLHFLSQEATT